MTCRVTPLLLGDAVVPDAIDVFWSLTKETGASSVPILAFLIEGGADGPLLIDTGMRDAERAMTAHGLGPHKIGPDQTIPAQLARLGYAPEDIRQVHLTHLHYDHAGGCRLLPNARFVLQRTELMAAAAPIGPEGMEIGGKGLFFDRADVAELVDPLWPRVDLMEGDYEPCPGVRCVLYANSHTPGHQCVYVETADGVTAIIGDIARKVELNIEREIMPGIFYDLESMRRALIDIKSRADVILPTHDWKALEAGGPARGPEGDEATPK